jgi:hypothetical protein
MAINTAMVTVSNKLIMLSVIMLNFVTLSVMAHDDSAILMPGPNPIILFTSKIVPLLRQKASLASIRWHRFKLSPGVNVIKLFFLFVADASAKKLGCLSVGSFLLGSTFASKVKSLLLQPCIARLLPALVANKKTVTAKHSSLFSAASIIKKRIFVTSNPRQNVMELFYCCNLLMFIIS